MVFEVEILLIWLLWIKLVSILLGNNGRLFFENIILFFIMVLFNFRLCIVVLLRDCRLFKKLGLIIIEGIKFFLFVFIRFVFLKAFNVKKSLLL